MALRKLVAVFGAVILMLSGMLLPGGVEVALASHPPGGHTYTTDADFDQGSMINVLHSIPDQLQLDDLSKPFPFIWIAASARGTVIKVDTATGQVLGEYLSAPQGMAKDPSRTTVDKDGNVWVGNRAEASGNKGSAIHIGIKENGQCQDRNGNGIIDTSTGLGDIRPWTNAGGADTNGGVSTADDECIIHFVRTNGVRNRHVSVDQNNNVWVAGGAFGDAIRFYDLLSPTGSLLRSLNMSNPAQIGEPGQIIDCCYGGLVDPSGIVWGANLGGDSLIRIDPTKPDGHPDLVKIVNLGRTSYGMGIDSQGNIWVSNFGYNTVQKVSPAGVVLGTFPTNGSAGRGVAVTHSDDHVWVANSGSASVSRLKNDGSLVVTIPVGNTPTGVSVDAAGKVWVTNLGSNNAMRIDPATNTVDLTVSLGAGANPYNYSDMTGSILIGPPNVGTWSVVHDTGIPGAPWGTVSWTADVFDDGALTVTAASSNDGVTFGPAVNVVNGGNLGVASGRYLKVDVKFQRSTTGKSPILYDLTVRPNGPPQVDLLPVAPYPEASAPITLTALASDPDGDPLTYAWSLSGPGVLVPAGNTATYFNDDGPASAQVTVTVSDGSLMASDTEMVMTVNVPPAPDAGPDQSEYWGLPVNFSGSAMDPSTADTLAGLNPMWDFGDGNTAPGYNVSHAYANPGLYVATLTAKDKDGGMGQDTAGVTIKKRPTDLAYTGDTTQLYGFPGTMSARLSDLVDPPTQDLAGRTVKFTIDGNTYSATTDANGDASYAAPGYLLPGTYTIDVAFDEDSHYLASAAQATLTVENGLGKITAGTLRMSNGGRGGFNVMYDGAGVKGELQFQNDTLNFHAHVMYAMAVDPSGTKGWFSGVGTNGVDTFVAYVEDNGEPGTMDVFKLWINGVPVNGLGNLTGGNVQIHQ